MSSMNQRQKRDIGYDIDSRRDDRRRRSRSRSRSRQRRCRRRSDDSRSRSRSRSAEYRRRHSGRHSRSRSRSLSRRDRYHSSRRHRDSHSRSHTPTRSHRSSRRDSRSRSSERKMRDGERRHNPSENKASTSNSGNNNQTTTQSPLESTDLQHLPLPKREPIGAYYNLDTDEPIDKERIHREMEEKLRQALAKEGKVYPPKKPEASHPVFANDGSFLEIFKKMQAQQQQNATPATVSTAVAPMPAAPILASTSNAAAYIAATSTGKSAPPPPIVGRRRGGKILKTGVVAKPKAQTEQSEDPKDFWSLYLAEVNKYKNHACDSDGGTRPLVKAERKLLSMSKKEQKKSETEYKMETVPMDPRFPQMNVTRHCWFSYVEYHRCQKSRGEGHESCAYFQKVFKTMCPNAWVEKWDEQREAGVFPGKEETMTYKMETAPFDPRFPNQNVTRYCYQSYIDYHRCQKIRGENYEPCNYFKKVFTSMCPNAWVEKWNDQREAGTFPGRI